MYLEGERPFFLSFQSRENSEGRYVRFGINTLGLAILRTTKYSPLKGTLEGFEGYHIEEDQGEYILLRYPLRNFNT